MMWTPEEQLELIGISHKAIAAAIAASEDMMAYVLAPMETLGQAVYVAMQLISYAIPIVRLQTDTIDGPLQLVAMETVINGHPVVDDDSLQVNGLYCTVLGYLSTDDYEGAGTAIVQAEHLAYPLVEFSALLLASQAAGKTSASGMRDYRPPE